MDSGLPRDLWVLDHQVFYMLIAPVDECPSQHPFAMSCDSGRVDFTQPWYHRFRVAIGIGVLSWSYVLAKKAPVTWNIKYEIGLVKKKKVISCHLVASTPGATVLFAALKQPLGHPLNLGSKVVGFWSKAVSCFHKWIKQSTWQLHTIYDGHCTVMTTLWFGSGRLRHWQKHS